MITKEQALSLKHGDIIHYDECKFSIGTRGGLTLETQKWRVSGKVKTWKRDLNRFTVPLKRGMYDFGYLDEHNASKFHLESDCQAIAAYEKHIEEFLNGKK